VLVVFAQWLLYLIIKILLVVQILLLVYISYTMTISDCTDLSAES